MAGRAAWHQLCRARSSRLGSTNHLRHIQSVFRSPERLGRRHLVLIDECHLVPHDGDGMYRTTLDALREVHPSISVCGFSATPFRLDSGHLTEGDDKIFDEVVFDYGIGRGIADGWLSPLSSKATRTTIDVRDVGRRGGEFIAGELEARGRQRDKIAAACDEIVTLGTERKCWLVFCCGIDHAVHVRDALRERGVSCEAVFGETPQDEREQIIADFRAGNIRCLVNVMVLTTGFDVPQIDLLAMLRPTLSTGLYVQMVGRGTRKAEGKTRLSDPRFRTERLPARSGRPGQRGERMGTADAKVGVKVEQRCSPSRVPSATSLIRWLSKNASLAAMPSRSRSRLPSTRPARTPCRSCPVKRAWLPVMNVHAAQAREMQQS